METFKKFLNKEGEIGNVTLSLDAIVYCDGLPGATPEEIVIFETGDLGQVLSLTPNYVEILTFSEKPIKVGTKVGRTDQKLSVPVSEIMLGKTLDPFGRLYGNKTKIEGIHTYMPINSEPKGIIERKYVKKPLETGTSMVDLMIPLGKGQKELLIGDRKIGKSNFIFHAILTQAREGNIAVYCCIGKGKLEIKKAEEFFTQHGIMDKIIIVASSSTDPAGVIYITPYSAMAVAEYFRDKGKDVLVVLDDISTHAKFYREISLLGKKFPGRNSYPGDIFYAHAKLMERAGNYITPTGGEASITCLPVVETVQGDISGYIQTNLMSMTDGHIFLDGNLFYQGRRPAVNPFLSVTRIGRQTQTPLRKSINRELTSFLTLYEKIQGYIHFGSEINESAKTTLATGDKILQLFRQSIDETIPVNVQIVFFAILWANIFNMLPMQTIVARRNWLTKVYLANEGNAKVQVDSLLDNAMTLNELIQKIRAGHPLIASLTQA
jgi:F-type H+-transporting ATPase subunit alpha